MLITALAEAAVSAQSGETDADPHPLARNAEHCMYWLRQANTGSRVLRVGIDAEQCFLVLENANIDDDFYLLSARGSDDYTEQPSLLLPVIPTANLLLDRSRLSSAPGARALGSGRSPAAIGRSSVWPWPM